MAYTNIDDPSANFTTTLWTGAGGSPRAITNDANSGNFQPDFVWTKGRNEAYEHNLYDSSRGTGTTKGLCSNDTSAEGTVSASYGYLSSFDSNGFTGTAGSSGQNAYFDTNAKTYVAWQWKANSGTTASNSNGSITSTVQANTDAGFSIVTYTGTGSAATVGHGLGVTPDMIIFKNRSGANVWATYHQSLGNNLKLELNGTGAQDADGAFMNGTLPTSSVFSVGASANTNTGSSNYVAYCFNNVQGYSKFGKYVGNGDANGPFVYTGFKPAFIMFKKSSDSGDNWMMYDNKRPGFNVTDQALHPNSSAAEYDNANANLDILSNGFKLRSSFGWVNQNTHTYIYMAFAENSFVTSTGIPTTAR